MERLFYAYGQDRHEDLPLYTVTLDQPPFDPTATRMFLQTLPQDSYIFVDCVGVIRVDFLHAILTLKEFNAI